jgi:hypothetical protein
MLNLHISCAYDQFEHLLAHTFIAAHIAQHYLEHFYTQTAILLKLLGFLHFLQLLLFSCIFQGELLLSFPLFGVCCVHLSTRGESLGEF